MPQPAAACQQTALPTSLTVVPDGFGQRGRLDSPHLGFFCCWLQRSPSQCAGSRLAGCCFLPGIRASPAEHWLASKPQKMGIFQCFLCPAAAAARAGMGNSMLFIWTFTSALETLDFHDAREMLWLITGWEEVQSTGLTSLGHVSLQLLLPPRAQAPPDDFRGKKKTALVKFYLWVVDFFFRPTREAVGLAVVVAALVAGGWGRGHRVPKQLLLGHSPLPPLFSWQRRTRPREKAPRDPIFLLCSSEGRELLPCLLLGLAA